FAKRCSPARRSGASVSLRRSPRPPCSWRATMPPTLPAPNWLSMGAWRRVCKLPAPLEHRAFSWDRGFPNQRTVIQPAWRWIMGRSYSLDLRRRVIDRIAGGQSRRGAAEDLSVSAAFAVKLVARHERTGSLEPAPQGRPAGTGKLAPYREFLIGRVKEKPDITMPELA